MTSEIALSQTTSPTSSSSSSLPELTTITTTRRENKTEIETKRETDTVKNEKNQEESLKKENKDGESLTFIDPMSGFQISKSIGEIATSSSIHSQQQQQQQEQEQQQTKDKQKRQRKGSVMTSSNASGKSAHQNPRTKSLAHRLSVAFIQPIFGGDGNAGEKVLKDALSTDATEVGRLKCSDGIHLWWRKYCVQRPKGTIIIVHSFGEHCGYYEDLCKKFTLDSFTCISYDQRGYGQSEGLRGHSESLDRCLLDLKELIEFHCDQSDNIELENEETQGLGNEKDSGIDIGNDTDLSSATSGLIFNESNGNGLVRRPLILYGHSSGASLCFHYALYQSKYAKEPLKKKVNSSKMEPLSSSSSSDGNNINRKSKKDEKKKVTKKSSIEEDGLVPIDAVIATAPYIKLTRSMPEWQKKIIFTLSKAFSSYAMEARVPTNQLTKNKRIHSLIEADRYRHNSISAKLFLEYERAGQYLQNIKKHFGEKEICALPPMVIFHGTRDYITLYKSSVDFVNTLKGYKSTRTEKGDQMLDVQFISLEGYFHDIHVEPDDDAKFYQSVINWLHDKHHHQFDFKLVTPSSQSNSSKRLDDRRSRAKRESMKEDQEHLHECSNDISSSKLNQSEQENGPDGNQNVNKISSNEQGNDKGYAEKNEIKEDEINKDEINKDEIKKDEIKKDEIKKDEIKKDEINKDEIKEDEINKDEINKDEIKKDEIKEDEINKDESVEN